MSHPDPLYDPADDWEEYEDDSEDGLCMGCKEHSSPSYMRHRVTGELVDPVSSCCGAGIDIP